MDPIVQKAGRQQLIQQTLAQIKNHKAKAQNKVVSSPGDEHAVPSPLSSHEKNARALTKKEGDASANGEALKDPREIPMLKGPLDRHKPRGYYLNITV